MKRIVFAMVMMAFAGAQAQSVPRDATAQALVQKNCAACHPVGQVTAAHKSKDDWSATVEKMIGFGAQISDKDYDVIVDYLARVQGPKK